MIDRHNIKYLFGVDESFKSIVPGSVVTHGLDNRSRGIVISVKVKNEIAVVLWSIEPIMIDCGGDITITAGSGTGTTGNGGSVTLTAGNDD